MSNNLRYKKGDTSPVFVTPDSTVAIEIGDLLYLDSSTKQVKPASAQTDQGSLVGNQDLFRTNFLGVAEQQSRVGDSAPIRVATAGDFEFDCAAAQFKVADRVGTVENAAGDALLDQSVVAVASDTKTIGRVVREQLVNATKVMVRIESQVSRRALDEETYLIEIADLAAGADIAASTVFAHPRAGTLVSAGLLAKGAFAGVDAANTMVCSRNWGKAARGRSTGPDTPSSSGWSP